jgi:hypothetical protein
MPAVSLGAGSRSNGVATVAQAPCRGVAARSGTAMLCGPARGPNPSTHPTQPHTLHKREGPVGRGVWLEAGRNRRLLAGVVGARKALHEARRQPRQPELRQLVSAATARALLRRAPLRWLRRRRRRGRCARHGARGGCAPCGRGERCEGRRAHGADELRLQLRGRRRQRGERLAGVCGPGGGSGEFPAGQPGPGNKHTRGQPSRAQATPPHPELAHVGHERGERRHEQPGRRVRVRVWVK